MRERAKEDSMGITLMGLSPESVETVVHCDLTDISDSPHNNVVTCLHLLDNRRGKVTWNVRQRFSEDRGPSADSTFNNENYSTFYPRFLNYTNSYP